MDSNNYPTYSYPDSNASSPRSRDLDYDNPPQSSFDDQSFSKVKFMVSYGGKIQPRSHDNFLSYLGGDTKILSVDRNVKFTTFQSKLASVVSPDMSSFVFKYQLPGEDLDALISVTNDDDLELMMQEFDRVMRGSIKIATARLRLFLFTDKQGSGLGDSRFGSANSETRTLSGPVCEPVQDMKFAVAPDASRVLAPTPIPIPPLPMPVPLPVQSTAADFLFGLDRMSVQVPGAASEQELVNQMNRLQISAQEVQHKLQLQNQQKQSAAMYPPKTEDSYADPYQKSAYWQTVEQSNQPPQHHLQAQHHQQLQQLQQQQQIQQQQLQQQQQQQKQQPQPVYLVHPAQQTNAYHTQSMMRPNQGGNYSVQQQQQTLSSREQQPVYSTPAGAQVIMQGESAAYAKQKAYENSVSGRHVFYAPGQQSGVVAPQYPAMSAAPVAVVVSGADVRSGSGDGKIVHKIITAASPAATV